MRLSQRGIPSRPGAWHALCVLPGPEGPDSSLPALTCRLSALSSASCPLSQVADFESFLENYEYEESSEEDSEEDSEEEEDDEELSPSRHIVTT